MLDDYSKYLTNIRNSLIQCGVGLNIKPIETYEDTIEAIDMLNCVLWYYSVLGISGSDNSLKGFFLPIACSYKEKLRSDCYKEFIGFISDYKKISKYGLLFKNMSYSESVSDDTGYSGVYTAESCSSADGIWSEDTLCMVNDEQVQEGYDEYVPFGVYVEDCDEIKPSVLHNGEGADCEYQEHGVFVEDCYEINSPESLNVEKGEYDYQEHGIYIEDFVSLSEEDSPEDNDSGVVDECVDHGIYVEDCVSLFEEKDSTDTGGDSDIEYVEHGIIVEYVVEIGDNDDDDEEGGSEDDEYENYESGYDEDGIQYDENGFEISDDEGFEVEEAEDEYVEDDDGAQYDENGFIISDDEGIESTGDEDYYEEGEDGFEESDGDLDEVLDEDLDESFDDTDDEYEGDVQYDENGFEIPDDLDESFDYEEDEEYDDSGFEIDYGEQSYSQGESDPVVSSSTKDVEETEIQRDMADTLQDLTSLMVHRGKKALKKLGKSFV